MESTLSEVERLSEEQQDSEGQKSSDSNGATVTPKKRVRVLDFLSILDGNQDMLELRFHELYKTMDVFFLLETEVNLKTGAPKKTLFHKENGERVKRFRSKILYLVIAGPTLAEKAPLRDPIRTIFMDPIIDPFTTLAIPTRDRIIA